MMMMMLMRLRMRMLFGCCCWCLLTMTGPPVQADAAACTRSIGRRLARNPASNSDAHHQLPVPVSSGVHRRRHHVVKLGIILPFSGSHAWSMPKVEPSIRYAVDSLLGAADAAPTNSSEPRRHRPGWSLLSDHRIEVYRNDSRCSDTYGPLGAFDMYLAGRAHLFLGPVCDYAVAPVARFSPHWNIPVITVGALVKAFDNRSEYSMLTRMSGSYSKLGVSLEHLVVRRNWTTPLNVWYKDFDVNSSDAELRSLLLLMSHNARIVVLCASPETVRKIMIKAAELNFDNGEYVFFNIDLFSSQAKLEMPWYDANDTETHNEMAKRAYESLMTITLRKPDSDKYKDFSNQVKERARKEFGDNVYADEEVNSFVGAFHDAVILYALALNETLEAGLDPTNGTEITRRMWNRTFEGITGTVSIDENGDRNADYSLLDLNPATGMFEVVANYYGNSKQYEEVTGKKIHWGAGRDKPPPDTPECGFDGLQCPAEQPFPEYGIVIIVFGILLSIVSTSSFIVYRHYKLEAELAEVNWRVRWDDIMFGAQEKRKLERSGSRMSLARRDSGSMNSLMSGDTIAYHLSDIGSKQIFTKTGSYKSTLVAIKKINRPFTVTKPLLMQFKKTRDLQNDHIVRFIGVCIDAPNQCILTEYCQKGSLQDVLENEQIKLDSMFKFSLMQDIVRGLSYLHSSDIRSHGNLKSSNCVVDSRFVLKITDFGLHALRGRNDLQAAEDAYIYYRSKLWTAPELLRMLEPPPEGTQKGDVYSFAIICQEIMYRNGPFWIENMDISPHEIYKLVKNGQRGSFRPTLINPTASASEDYGDGCSSEELVSMVKRCWAEDPAERPDFHSLKTIIKRINKDGDCSGNLLDNLLSRMEQYAYNLEGLVEARTADYLEQKKKAEDLLYMMLPRSVAVQLMHGQTVKAEKYESVSIYFSDICGFTAMSAESTPMQVVDFLNDLYTTFDSVIDLFDVYKVETIGDAYMVVSGLPVRNGILHSREIARMAISLLNAVKSFKIRHRPHDQLKLRIGIHSGPVCAGIVGLKMPRYCLFGDTVNTASRMESNGEPLKIHVSPYTKELLDSFDTFILELRGPVAMKGKGEIITWWLVGENNPDFPDLAPPAVARDTDSTEPEKCEFKLF